MYNYLIKNIQELINMEVVDNSVDNIGEDSASIESFSQAPTTSVVNKEGKRKPKSRLFSSFKLKKSGAEWKTPKGKQQTPKRPRTYTTSPEDTVSPIESIPLDEDLLEYYVLTAMQPYITDLEEAKEEITELKNERTDLNGKLRVLTQEIKDLKENQVKQDSHSRKKNLRIRGVREDANETKNDSKRKVFNMFRDYGVRIEPKDIENAHRVGPKLHNAPRPILVNFLYAEDKEMALSVSRSIFFDHGISMENDFPEEIEKKRRELRPIVQAAVKIKTVQGRNKYKASLNVDQLIVNGKRYTTKDTNKLPEEIRPENISTITKHGKTGFFTFQSPLSNHYTATQKVRGIKYTSNEQFYMHQKSLTFGDRERADRILKESDPRIQKKLGDGRRIANFKQSVWDERCQDIMLEGLRAKFTQNAHLDQFLKKTGDTELLECNPGDTYWGIGIHIRDPKVWKNQWIGKAHNHLGKLLTEVRRELRQGGQIKSTPV